MDGRKLHEAVFSGEKVDRLPYCGLGVWGEALGRWRGEGLGADEDPVAVLGLEGDERLNMPLDLNM